MVELLQMWALVEILGLVCLPLTVTVFHNLADRGWAFSKAIGMALLAFGVWLPLMLVHVLPFSQLFILGIALIILAFNIIGMVRMRHTIAKLVRVNIPYILATEIIFLGMVFLLGWLRSYLPDIRSFEMYMDEGFIAGIMRSPNFPPADMWFAGSSINYYYYAHFTVAVLAKLLGQSPSIAFNTGICLFFGLTAVNLFGVTCNIVAWARYVRSRVKASDEASTTSLSALEVPERAHPSLLATLPFGLCTIVVGLILGNLAATQQWWKNHGDLSQYDWFAPSRVVDKTINEFPAFSFLLSCFHAHVLALAFTILGIGLALNLFLEPDGKGLAVFGRGIRLPFTLGVTSLVLGGLFTMNGWDFPTYLGLTLICIILQQWIAYDVTISTALLLDILISGGSLTALSFIWYLPFYQHFISPSQGIGIVGPADRSQLGAEVLIYGLFAFVFLSLLLVSALKHPLFSFATLKKEVERRDAIHYAPAASGAMNSVSTSAMDDAPTPSGAMNSAPPSAMDDAPTTSASFEEHGGSSSLGRSLGFVAIVVLMLLELAALILIKNSTTFVVIGSIALLGAVLMFYHLGDRAHAFTLLLGSVAFGLVAVCEVFYLRDVFAGNYPRMNTVFKFYFQAWALLSITAGAGLYFIWESFRPLEGVSMARRWAQRELQFVWSAALLVLLIAGMAYPLAAIPVRYERTNLLSFRPYLQRTNSLDGLEYLQSDPAHPGDYAAIRWLNANVQGNPVIVESIGDDYSEYGRVSVFTGLPTLMGWVGHEYQWRVNWLNNPENSADFNRRGADVDTIYTNSDFQVVLSVMKRYHAQYVYVGPLEYKKYALLGPRVDLHRFSTFMQTVYNANGVTIYKIR